MATKKTSRKTAATTSEPRKKLNGDLTKTPIRATAAAATKDPKPAPAASVAKVKTAASVAKVKTTATAAKVKTTATAAKGKKTAAAAKPAKTANKVASPPQSAKDEVLGVEASGIAPQPSGPSRHEIAARAAAIWREKGGAPFDNWIQAERELGA